MGTCAWMLYIFGIIEFHMASLQIRIHFASMSLRFHGQRERERERERVRNDALQNTLRYHVDNFLMAHIRIHLVQVCFVARLVSKVANLAMQL